jgi:large subunit ribosomal protein L25
MSTAVKLSVTKRPEQGTRACRNLRIQGIVPCNVYGHGQTPIAVKVAADKVRPIINSGAKVVDLDIDGASDSVLIRDVQWDTFSNHVYHVDFLRVDATQRVLVEVPLQLRGTAPGVVAGGHLEQPMHSLEIECPALEVPDFIIVKIAALGLGQTLHVKDLADLPAGVVVKTPGDLVVVHVAAAMTEAEMDAADAADGAEPELIRKKKEDEADEKK